MFSSRIARLGAAVAAAALMVPAFATAATAASYPKVPTLAAAGKVYPHLKGGSVYAGKINKVYGPGKRCDQTKRVKGATGSSASYAAAGTSSSTAAAPGLVVIAYRLPSTAKAKGLLATSATKAKKCPAGGVGIPGVKKTKVKKLKVRLGDASQGYTVKVTTDSGTYISNMILVRKGKYIVTTSVSSMDGKTPAVKKSVKAAQLAVKTAS